MLCEFAIFAAQNRRPPPLSKAQKRTALSWRGQYYFGQIGLFFNEEKRPGLFCLPVALAWAGSLTGTDVESVRFPCFVLQPTISAVPSHTTFVPKTATQLPVGKQQMGRSHGPPRIGSGGTGPRPSPPARKKSLCQFSSLEKTCRTWTKGNSPRELRKLFGKTPRRHVDIGTWLRQ